MQTNPRILKKKKKPQTQKPLDGHKHKYSMYEGQGKHNKCNVNRINHLKHMNEHFI